MHIKGNVKGNICEQGVQIDEAGDQGRKEAVLRTMILYIFVAVLTVFLGLMVNNHCKIQQNIVSRQQILNRLCLVSVFLLLFGLAACRLNVGNDYAKYVEFMHLINCDAFVPTEAGF